ncbi:MAG: hypothetical protein GF401_10060 [Chitinivibrionales bacterium]|nr:hypothetical protein [Chitinivibrionales bacterium]
MRNQLPVLTLWLFLLSLSAAAQPADSLNYYHTRNKMMQSQDEDILKAVKAADALAGQGFYTEALDLLNEIAPVIQTPVPPGSAPKHRPPEMKNTWRIMSGMDYYYLKDIGKADTSDQEARDSIQQLKEEPFAVFAKASLEYTPSSAFIRSLTPSVYIGNNRTSIDLESRFHFFKKWLNTDIYAKAEKQLMRSDEFRGDTPDTSDLLEGEIRLELQSFHLDNPAGFSLPLAVTNRTYRYNRSGRSSYLEYSTTPLGEFTTRDFKKTYTAGFLVQYKDYYDRNAGIGDSSGIDSLDIYRFGPTLTADLLLNRITCNFMAGYLFEHYPNSRRIDTRSDYEFEGRIERKINELIRVPVILDYLYSHEEYNQNFLFSVDSIIYNPFPRFPLDTVAKDTTIPAAYSLYGSSLKAGPGIELSPSPFLQISLEIPVIYRRYNAIDPVADERFSVIQYIDETSVVFEPEIGFRLAPQIFDFRFYFAWLRENMEEKSYYYESSNTGVRLRSDLYWSLTDKVSLSGTAEYQHKRYRSNSRNSNNVSASFSAQMKL